MMKREEHIQEIKENMNNVEDKVFASFCKRLGVKNIRHYEERELVMQQERARKRAEFEQQIDAINTQLDFEKQKDTKSNLKLYFYTLLKMICITSNSNRKFGALGACCSR